jgi:hypothetical protein
MQVFTLSAAALADLLDKTATTAISLRGKGAGKLSAARAAARDAITYARANLAAQDQPAALDRLAALPPSQYVLVEATPDTPQAITLNRLVRRDGTAKWAIRSGRNCYSKFGRWEWEPAPSRRDDAFLARCRFNTAHEAYKFWLAQRRPDPYARFRHSNPAEVKAG